MKKSFFFSLLSFGLFKYNPFKKQSVILPTTVGIRNGRKASVNNKAKRGNLLFAKTRTYGNFKYKKAPTIQLSFNG